MIYGNQGSEIKLTANIPEDSLQALIDPWWIKTEDHRLQKGALVYTHVPFFDCTPLTLEPIGRTNPIDHKEAEIKIKQLRIGDVTRRSPLPGYGYRPQALALRQVSRG